MRYLTPLLIASSLLSPQFAYGQSKLLENVKRNPKEAIALCQKFRGLNSRGISSGSKEVIEELSREKNLSFTDAEILSIYVIAMNCPEIK
ncbi:hypothetical protein [Prochlorococcus marinus]|uniref:hypothetical protein n=1 Tax=Prochlorococcus marinus TaxID=1219 RepID=UPI0022B33B5E|nr:hypothetical protein [Prochlorococcus marinus]